MRFFTEKLNVTNKLRYVIWRSWHCFHKTLLTSYIFKESYCLNILNHLLDNIHKALDLNTGKEGGVSPGMFPTSQVLHHLRAATIVFRQREENLMNTWKPKTRPSALGMSDPVVVAWTSCRCPSCPCPPCHMGMSYLISLTPMLLRNIAHDGSFKHF